MVAFRHAQIREYRAGQRKRRKKNRGIIIWRKNGTGVTEQVGGGENEQEFSLLPKKSERRKRFPGLSLTVLPWFERAGAGFCEVARRKIT
jgi:hypothetical protein